MKAEPFVDTSIFQGYVEFCNNGEPPMRFRAEKLEQRGRHGFRWRVYVLLDGSYIFDCFIWSADDCRAIYDAWVRREEFDGEDE